jgi:hypothetical protein
MPLHGFMINHHRRAQLRGWRCALQLRAGRMGVGDDMAAAAYALLEKGESLTTALRHIDRAAKHFRTTEQLRRYLRAHGIPLGSVTLHRYAYGEYDIWLGKRTGTRVEFSVSIPSEADYTPAEWEHLCAALESANATPHSSIYRPIALPVAQLAPDSGQFG